MSEEWQTEIDGSIALRSDGLIIIDFILEGYFIEWEVTVFPNHYELGLRDSGNMIRIKDVIDARVEIADILKTNYPKLHSKTIEHVKQLVEEAWQPPCISNRQVQETMANAQ